MNAGHHRTPRLLILVTTVGMLLAGCADQPTATPTAKPTTVTPTTESSSPTPSAEAAETLPAATATLEPPSLTPTPLPATETPVPTTAAPTATSVSPTPTSAPPTPTLAPSPTASEAVIHSFRADVDVADPGETITLTWHWSGGTRASIYHLFCTGQLSIPNWEVGPTGSLTYTIRPERRNYDSFVLYVGEDGVSASKSVTVKLTCPDKWFFSPAPDICPADAPQVSDGAEQHFEHGVMLWVSHEDRIYVLFDDGYSREWKAYRDEWDEGDPTLDPDIVPPDGRQQPVRGFGLLWREESGLRERLGWAVEEEHGYQTALQRTSHCKYSDLYIRAFEGGVWKLRPNGSDWEHTTTEQ